MTDSPATKENDAPRYRIGAVCRLTGISQHVLRVWEKRYAVVVPERSETRRRLYRESDINRLALLKALVDRGQAIGSIAGLSNAELEQRLQQTVSFRVVSEGKQKPDLALFGETLALTADDCAASDFFQLMGQFDRISDYNDVRFEARLDVAVVEYPLLHPDSVLEVTRLANRLNTRQLILVYDYAPRAALQRLSNTRITALRSPLDITALEAVIAWRFGLATQQGMASEDVAGLIPARRFNDRELALSTDKIN